MGNESNDTDLKESPFEIFISLEEFLAYLTARRRAIKENPNYPAVKASDIGFRKTPNHRFRMTCAGFSEPIAFVQSQLQGSLISETAEKVKNTKLSFGMPRLGAKDFNGNILLPCCVAAWERLSLFSSENDDDSKTISQLIAEEWKDTRDDRSNNFRSENSYIENEPDYMADTFDALTDGMLGDYEDFGGDFNDLLGWSGRD